jgi:GNAT superfamily N-acetyltransferase
MKFDHEYQEHVRLAEEVDVRLRLVQPADKERLREGLLALSGASRQKRFFGGKGSLSNVELRYFTELDEFDHFAIGAVELNGSGEEGDGIGIARFIRLPHDAECAEVAITVIDRMQGKGVGRTLLEKLVDAAVERDVKRFRFECLPHNQEMKRLVEQTCNVVEFRNDSGVIVAEVELTGRHLGSHEHSVNAFERLFALLRALVPGPSAVKNPDPRSA